MWSLLYWYLSSLLYRVLLHIFLGTHMSEYTKNISSYIAPPRHEGWKVFLYCDWLGWSALVKPSGPSWGLLGRMLSFSRLGVPSLCDRRWPFRRPSGLDLRSFPLFLPLARRFRRYHLAKVPTNLSNWSCLQTFGGLRRSVDGGFGPSFAKDSRLTCNYVIRITRYNHQLWTFECEASPPNKTCYYMS